MLVPSGKSSLLSPIEDIGYKTKAQCHRPMFLNENKDVKCVWDLNNHNILISSQEWRFNFKKHS